MAKRKRKIEKDDIQKFYDYDIYVPTRTIYLGNEEVDSELASKIVKAIHIFDNSSKEPINIIINNPGGCEYNGLAIYGAMRSCRCKIIACVFGHAMSMASIILQAADVRILNSLSTIMIHDGTIAMVNTDQEVVNGEKWAAESKRLREMMYKIYYNRIKEIRPRITIKEIENMCRNDNIIPARDAVKLGLADEIMYEKIFKRKKK